MKKAIQYRASGERDKFNTLVIDGYEWLWDKIENCEGKSPNFAYEVEEVEWVGELLTVVYIYDGKSENGGFIVTEINGTWYLSDWVNKVRCR